MKYFIQEEFACKCGCGLSNTKVEVMEALDYARAKAGVPFVINSGCRCPKHNAEVGGSEHSSHLTGDAVDIATPNSFIQFKVIKALLDVGCERIGVGKKFVHADWDNTKLWKRTWTY